MIAKLPKQWFLFALWGVVGLAAAAPRLLEPIASRIQPQIIVIVVMFLMSVTLDTRHIVEAAQRPGVVLLGVALGYILVPLFGWVLALAFWGQQPDFAVGLLIMAAMPTTLASATIWTRLAGGNDAVSLLVTVVSNSLSFGLTPLVLLVTLGRAAHLDSLEILRKLFLTVVLPVLVGQGARTLPWLRQQVTVHKGGLSMLSQFLILSMVLGGMADASWKIWESAAGFAWLAFGGLIGAVAVMHGLALLSCWCVTRAARIARGDQVALLFAGSQKTLPAGLYVAGEFFSAQPLAPLPILLYHSLQLIIDSWVAQKARESPSEESERGVAN